MASRSAKVDSLAKLFDESARPIYTVDAQWRIVYANPSLSAWVDLELRRIVGRRVEFHSEAPGEHDSRRAEVSPLTDLCPPPSAMAGQASHGTLSCQGRDGRLRHRAAEFIPIALVGSKRKAGGALSGGEYGVLVLMSGEDLASHQVAAHATQDPTADELHRTIRQFRDQQSRRYSIRSLLGSSEAMHKVRAQVEVAAARVANVLILGKRGSGRSHVGRAIHYHAAGGRTHDAVLWPVDCDLLTEDLWERTRERLRPGRATPADLLPTLLLENLEAMPAAIQSAMVELLRKKELAARVIATCDPRGNAESRSSFIRQPREQSREPHPMELQELPGEPLEEHSVSEELARSGCGVLPALVDLLSTLAIHLPPLAERIEDLPILAQYFLETCNRGSEKQVGSLRPEALDALALYSWPGELAQLQQVIETAHAACGSHGLATSDLPPVIHHAEWAAAYPRREPEKIVLDELLARVEREAIERALARAKGNKSGAAALLGMTRPRLYRRLVQLGLAGGDVEALAGEPPEFIEEESSERELIEREPGDKEPGE